MLPDASYRRLAGRRSVVLLPAGGLTRRCSRCFTMGLIRGEFGDPATCVRSPSIYNAGLRGVKGWDAGKTQRMNSDRTVTLTDDEGFRIARGWLKSRALAIARDVFRSVTQHPPETMMRPTDGNSPRYRGPYRRLRGRSRWSRGLGEAAFG